MKDIFDYVVNKLNENSPVLFKGNHYFNFYQNKDKKDKFIVYNDKLESLEKEEIEFIPVNEQIDDMIKFIGQNKRFDFQKVYSFMIRQEGFSFDFQGEAFKRILAFVESENGAVIQGDNFKASIVVDNPKMGGTFTMGEWFYVNVELSIKGTYVKKGMFGQECKVQIKKEHEENYHDIDFEDFFFATSKGTHQKTLREITEHRAISTTIQPILIFNYNREEIEKELIKGILTLTPRNTKFKLKVEIDGIIHEGLYTIGDSTPQIKRGQLIQPEIHFNKATE